MTTRKEMIRYVVLMHALAIFANLLLITMPAVVRAIVGALLLAACLVLLYRQGAGLGESACSLQSSIQRMDRPADKTVRAEAYHPGRMIRAAALAAVVPLAVSLVYLGAYRLSRTNQGYIYGETALEEMEAAGDAESLEELLQQDQEDVQEAAEEVPPMTTLDRAVFGLRIATTVLGLPYWSIVSIWQSQYVLLSPLAVIVLLLYPFVMPAAAVAGYFQGPRFWKKTEEAMAKGKRRAKARSRIIRRKQGPREQKPMI